jgi:hypothetical protein
MAVDSATIEMAMRYSVSNTLITGARAVRVNDSLSSAQDLTVATYNRLLRKRYSLAGSGTQVIDLASFTDDYNAGAAVVLTKAAGIMVVSNGQPFSIGPNNAADPLQWFWGGTTQTLVFSANSSFCAFEPETFTTGSKLLLTNTGASTGTFDVVIFGGT